MDSVCHAESWNRLHWVQFAMLRAEINCSGFSMRCWELKSIALESQRNKLCQTEAYLQKECFKFGRWYSGLFSPTHALYPELFCQRPGSDCFHHFGQIACVLGTQLCHCSAEAAQEDWFISMSVPTHGMSVAIRLYSWALKCEFHAMSCVTNNCFSLFFCQPFKTYETFLAHRSHKDRVTMGEIQSTDHLVCHSFSIITKETNCVHISIIIKYGMCLFCNHSLLFFLCQLLFKLYFLKSQYHLFLHLETELNIHCIIIYKLQIKVI